MQYDLEYVSQKSIKGQAIADQLADFPLTEEIKAEDDFPDERICNIQQPQFGTISSMALKTCLA